MGWEYSIKIGGYTYNYGDIVFVKGQGHVSAYAGSGVGITYGDNYRTRFYGVYSASGSIDYPICVGESPDGTSPTANYFIKPDQIVSGGTPDKFTYSFNANGGSGAPSAMTKTYGVHFTFPSTKPTRNGYIFNGWYNSNVNSGTIYSAGQQVIGLPDQDIEWYAKWTGITYYVKYNGNGSTSGSMSNSTHIYGTAKTLTANAYKRVYTVTLNGNGASNLSSLTSTYSFKNWNTNSSGTETTLTNQHSVSGLTTTNGATVNIYAQWTSASVTLPSHSRTGYTFNGWNTKSDGTGTSYTSGAKYTPTSNTTLYAQWKVIEYPITYTLNDGTVSSTNPTSYNIETATFTLKNPTKTGYTFTGWTGSNGSTPSTNVSISKGSTGNKSFTANWIEHKLTVNYYSNYATYADFAEGFNLLNPVLKNSNVLVHSREFKYDDEYSSGLHNYSESGNVLYMKRLGYSATGQWGTEPDGGILIGEDDSFNSGQSIATKVGLSLATGDASINLYAQWDPANIAFYKINGEWKLCHTYYKIDGVWKPAIMYKKINGTWKRSVLK